MTAESRRVWICCTFCWKAVCLSITDKIWIWLHYGSSPRAKRDPTDRSPGIHQRSTVQGIKDAGKADCHSRIAEADRLQYRALPAMSAGCRPAGILQALGLTDCRLQGSTLGTLSRSPARLGDQNFACHCLPRYSSLITSFTWHPGSLHQLPGRGWLQKEVSLTKLADPVAVH